MASSEPPPSTVSSEEEAVVPQDDVATDESDLNKFEETEAAVMSLLASEADNDEAIDEDQTLLTVSEQYSDTADSEEFPIKETLSRTSPQNNESGLHDSTIPEATVQLTTEGISSLVSYSSSSAEVSASEDNTQDEPEIDTLHETAAPENTDHYVEDTKSGPDKLSEEIHQEKSPLSPGDVLAAAADVLASTEDINQVHVEEAAAVDSMAEALVKASSNMALSADKKDMDVDETDIPEAENTDQEEKGSVHESYLEEKGDGIAVHQAEKGEASTEGCHKESQEIESSQTMEEETPQEEIVAGIEEETEVAEERYKVKSKEGEFEESESELNTVKDSSMGKSKDTEEETSVKTIRDSTSSEKIDDKTKEKQELEESVTKSTPSTHLTKLSADINVDTKEKHKLEKSTTKSALSAHLTKLSADDVNVDTKEKQELEESSIKCTSSTHLTKVLADDINVDTKEKQELEESTTKSTLSAHLTKLSTDDVNVDSKEESQISCEKLMNTGNKSQITQEKFMKSTEESQMPSVKDIGRGKGIKRPLEKDTEESGNKEEQRKEMKSWNKEKDNSSTQPRVESETKEKEQVQEKESEEMETEELKPESMETESIQESKPESMETESIQELKPESNETESIQVLKPESNTKEQEFELSGGISKDDAGTPEGEGDEIEDDGDKKDNEEKDKEDGKDDEESSTPSRRRKKKKRSYERPRGEGGKFMKEKPDPSMLDEETRMDYNLGQDEDSQGSASKREVRRFRCEVIVPESTEVFTADKVVEYVWPLEGVGEHYFIQEQISQYLGIMSFKRKYPDLRRRAIDMQERDYLKEKGLVSDMACDLGLTAVRSEDVLDVMFNDFPSKFEELQRLLRERKENEMRERGKVSYSMANIDKSKMQEYGRKAAVDAARWNANFNKEKRDERRYSFDLQTFSLQMPLGRGKKLPPEYTKIGFYPVAVLPGQFTNHYKEYSPQVLKTMPLTSIMAAPVVPDQLGSDGGSSDSEDEQPIAPVRPIVEEPVKEEKVGEGAPRCKVCNGTKNRNKSGKPEPLIICGSCKSASHPTCIDLTLVMVPKIESYNWQCMDCKTCVTCNDPDDEDKMIFCDMCDRGYHIYCVGLRRVPNGRWHCKECAMCASCGSKTPAGNEHLKNAEWQHEFKKDKDNKQLRYATTLCVPCDKYWKRRQFCYVCLKVYRSIPEDGMVRCSNCPKYIHREVCSTMYENERFCINCYKMRNSTALNHSRIIAAAKKKMASGY